MSLTRSLVATTALAAAATGVMSPAHAARPLPHAERVSVTSAGEPATVDQGATVMTPDGRYVAFGSGDRSLQPSAPYNDSNVFVHDRRLGTTEMVSITDDGQPLSGGLLDMTPDGRFVVFEAYRQATPEDSDSLTDYDVVVRDRLTGKNEIVSTGFGTRVNQYGTSATISDDGQRIAFSGTDCTERNEDCTYSLYVRDRAAGTTVPIAQRRSGRLDGGRPPRISGNGEVVVFDSRSDIVGRDRNSGYDVFLHDLTTGRLHRITRGNKASETPQPTRSGRYIFFSSIATDLVRHDTNRSEDVFRYDRATKKVRRVSVDSRERQGSQGARLKTISDTGRYVLMTSGSDLGGRADRRGSSDVYRRDVRRGTTSRLFDTWGWYGSASISNAGREVALVTSKALLPGHEPGWLNAYVVRP